MDGYNRALQDRAFRLGQRQSGVEMSFYDERNEPSDPTVAPVSSLGA